jgi:hypothetical protein
MKALVTKEENSKFLIQALAFIKEISCILFSAEHNKSLILNNIFRWEVYFNCKK